MARIRLIENINRSIKWKLVAMISVVLLAILLSVAYFTYYKTTETIEKDAAEFSNQILHQVNLNLNRYLLNYQQDFLAIATNSATERWLAVRKGDDLSSYIAFQEIVNNYLQVLIYQHPEVLSVTFYNVNGNEMHFTNRYGLDVDYQFGDEKYMEKMEGQGGIYFDVTFSDNYINRRLPVMTMVKKVTYGSNTGYIKLDIDLQPAVEIVNGIELGDTGITMISDTNGKIIAHPDLQRVTSKLENDILDRLQGDSGSFIRESSSEIVIYQIVPFTKWRLISIIPYYEFAESVFHIRDITLITVFIGLLLSIVMIVLISSSFTKRIGEMKMAMSQSKTGNFKDRVKVKGKDELADLALTYNMMLDYLEDSINKLAESKIQQQEATLSALQSQIDSHFLYNSLETINSMANLAEQKEIEQITLALSKMLRYISDYKSTIVTVEDELAHLEHYLQIHRIRFGRKISYCLHIEETCKPALSLKAIIQPIVENSIKHNIDVNGEPLHIDVSVKEIDGRFVSVEITDNGLGFAEQKLAELQQKINELNTGTVEYHSKRIGLINVHYRLKVYYISEPSAGLSVGNRGDGAGAKVTVLFPLRYGHGGGQLV